MRVRVAIAVVLLLWPSIPKGTMWLAIGVILISASAAFAADKKKTNPPERPAVQLARKI
jgi:hypothetical protein